MLKHRSLTLHKFVSVVSPDLLQRYFESLPLNQQPGPWATLNGQALEDYLARPEHAATESVVRQDLEKVNDIAGEGIGIILKAFRRFDIGFDQDRTNEENALRFTWTIDGPSTTHGVGFCSTHLPPSSACTPSTVARFT